MNKIIKQRIGFWLNRFGYCLSHSSCTWWNQLFIKTFIWFFKVNMREAEKQKVQDFKNFNAFFTRSLKPGIRPIEGHDQAIVSPVDGILSDAWSLDQTTSINVKGTCHDLESLLMLPERKLAQYRQGLGFTFYLAPWHYHCIHMPISATPEFFFHIPGLLSSVKPKIVERKQSILAQNERLVIELKTAIGPMILVMVGARFVAGMETCWTGWVNKGYKQFKPIQVSGDSQSLAKGQPFGCFHFGSTVILLLPNQSYHQLPSLKQGQEVKMGQIIAVPSEDIA
jgi:phosphatidylserine decarboxylase